MYIKGEYRFLDYQKYNLSYLLTHRKRAYAEWELFAHINTGLL
jgi:hypothetical protein